MKWYYNSRTGAIANFPTAIGDFYLHSGTGWHGPFNTQADALTYFDNNAGANPGWARPTGLLGSIENIPRAVGGIATQPITDINNKLDTLTNGININNWLIRISEIVLGVVLIAVGIAKLTGNENVVYRAVKGK
jgi:hypothetical protein